MPTYKSKTNIDEQSTQFFTIIYAKLLLVLRFRCFYCFVFKCLIYFQSFTSLFRYDGASRQESTKSRNWTSQCPHRHLHPHHPDNSIRARQYFNHSSQWPLPSRIEVIRNNYNVAHCDRFTLTMPLSSTRKWRDIIHRRCSTTS